MTPELDPYLHVPPPTDEDYADDDGRYGTVVALRGELVEQREDRDLSDSAEILPDGYRASDVGNAERLIIAADGRLRYVHRWQRWIVYTGGKWVLDAGDALVTQVAKRVARGLFLAAMNAAGDGRDALWKHAKKCETSAAIGNMIRLARAIPGVIVTHEELDSKPWLLNVENGTIDLRTGELRAHDPADLITKQAPVTYDPTATAPLWEQCLLTWQPSPEVRAFLQRAAGSGATGHPVEALIVNVGHGGNGKTKFYEALTGVLGEYAVQPHRSLLVKQRHDPHPTVIASLHGARMLVASETEDGDRLDETQVKNLTGGDMLRARRMHEDEWSFRPSHTAFLHTNHPPRIRGSDEGIWRRLKIVRWDVTIPKQDVDEHLPAKLAREAAGILNWIVVGAAQWSRDGLSEPAAVTHATNTYRASEDHVGRFLADCCTLDSRFSTPAKAVREAYEKWCADTGEEVWSARRVGASLTARGLESQRLGNRKTNVWAGLTVNGESPAQATLRPDAAQSSGFLREISSLPSNTDKGAASGRNGTEDVPEIVPAQPETFDLDEPF